LADVFLTQLGARARAGPRERFSAHPHVVVVVVVEELKAKARARRAPALEPVPAQEPFLARRWLQKSRADTVLQAATREQIAHCRIKIDEPDPKHALVEIAESKAFVANAALRVIGIVTQAHGGGGVSPEFPLAIMWASVDGPDEVHVRQLGTNENKKGKDLLDKMERQTQAIKALFERYGHQAGRSVVFGQGERGQGEAADI
jgi:acyl-CoA dehydrogenase